MLLHARLTVDVRQLVVVSVLERRSLRSFAKAVALVFQFFLRHLGRHFVLVLQEQSERIRLGQRIVRRRQVGIPDVELQVLADQSASLVAQQRIVYRRHGRWWWRARRNLILSDLHLAQFYGTVGRLNWKFIVICRLHEVRRNWAIVGDAAVNVRFYRWRVNCRFGLAVRESQRRGALEVALHFWDGLRCLWRDGGVVECQRLWHDVVAVLIYVRTWHRRGHHRIDHLRRRRSCGGEELLKLLLRR